jgi:ribosome-interacting GTPase 1
MKNSKLDPKLEAAINEVIRRSAKHSPTNTHFLRLKRRLQQNKKLTKKMTENLEWIVRDFNIGVLL